MGFLDRFKRKPIDKDTKIDKLPPKHLRHENWEYEILRPWEPQPPKNYFELLYRENPWRYDPPSNCKIFTVLFVFLLFTYTCGFAPWILEYFLNPRMMHSLQILKTPPWLLPWWFHIFFHIVSHFGSALGIWVLYLTGGFKKHRAKMIPYCVWFLLEMLWVDMLLQFRNIALATIICIVSIVVGLITMIVFAYELAFSSALLLCQEAFLVYQFIVCIYIWKLNGSTY